MNKKVAKWGRFETKVVHLKDETAKRALFATKKRRYFVRKNPWDKNQKIRQDILHSIWSLAPVCQASSAQDIHVQLQDLLILIRKGNGKTQSTIP